MAVVWPSTAPPQARPPTRGRSAPHGPLALAIDVLLCCFDVALWACSATAAVAIAARQTCGVDSRAAAVMEALFLASVFSTCLLYFASRLLFAWFPESFEIGEREIGGAGGADATGPAAAERRRRRENTGARRRQYARHNPSPIAWMLLFIAITGVVIQVLLIKPTWMERFCLLAETALFHFSVVLSDIKFPALMIRLRSTYAKLKRGTAGLN
ncbi:unnamed protein product [Urochloa humidicola]